jgi:thiosulfate dehydrogenase [quinone] large subunit
MSVNGLHAEERLAGPVVMDAYGRIRLPLGAAVMAALLRIGLGLLYLWAFISQGFGVEYTNTTNPDAVNPSHGWHFSYSSDLGWITSGFSHSPTAGFVNGTYGPLSFIPKDLPTGVDDTFWIIALGGLGIALTFGIAMGIAGWGGFLLNIVIWFSNFPPANNPVIDGEHMAFAFSILLLMFLQAGNYWGLGRWWRRHTPIPLH